MKKLLSILVMVLCTLTAFAQEKDVTTFLGIPVDGSKSAMRKKLIAKGFTPNTDIGTEIFEGEFNGHDVNVYIVTNNNKVWRIMLGDKICQDEASIRIRFNTLCHQFEKNERYYTPEDFTIPEQENISYEMTVNKKLYYASYFQIPNSKSIDALADATYQELRGKYTEEQLKNPAKEIEEDWDRIIEEKRLELYAKKPVWFCIKEFEGKYHILMYYDNVYNQANGEDL